MNGWSCWNNHIDMEESVRKYDNGDLVIVWKPHLCTHSGVCVKTLPHVYNPREKPWIKLGVADAKELMAQIDKCTSGALSYELK